MQIDLGDLVRALNAVIQHVKEQRQGPAEIPGDYYREINQATLCGCTGTIPVYRTKSRVLKVSRCVTR